MDDSGSSRLTWSRLSWLAPAAMGTVFLLVMVILAGGFEPFLAIFAAILLITAFVGRRFPRRAGPITVIVILALLLLMNLPAIADDIAHPESFLNFAIFGVLLLVLDLSGIVASVLVLVGRSDGAAARFAYAAGGIIVVAAIASAVATAGFENDTAAAGDLRVVAEEVEFTPASLTGSGGTVGVFIENKDPVRHTFTIEELDIEVNLPGNADQRVDITAPPGEYEFVCKVPGHDDMMGTLTISG
jgi:plastocyanin